MSRTATQRVSKHFHSTVSKDRQHNRQVQLKTAYVTRKAQQVATEIQVRTVKVAGRKYKVFIVVQFFLKYATAAEVPDKRVDKKARTPVEEVFSGFGPAHLLSCDGGLDLEAVLAKHVTSMLGIGKMQTYTFNPQRSETVN